MMADSGQQIYLGTVLLEPNRWTAEKLPTFKVSEWADAIRVAGFDGVELWENHAVLADEDERVALGHMPLPVAIFNSYCTFDDAGAAARGRAAEFVRRYKAAGVKFNFGADPARTDEYVRNLRAWADELPAGCRLLCECHGGTILETPGQAARVLGPLAGRVEIIVHPFTGDRATLQQWLDCFGSAVTHAHVVARQGHAVIRLLRDIADEAQSRIALMRAAGFSGSWTVEFTRGVALSPENRQALLDNAACDLTFLCETMDRRALC